MTTIPPNFDGAKFAAKYNLSVFDFHIEGDQLVCPSLPNLTGADLLDCIVDTARLARIQARKTNAKGEAALATQFKTLTPQQAVNYIENNVTNLSTAKDILKIMARILIAMRDEIWPDLPE